MQGFKAVKHSFWVKITYESFIYLELVAGGWVKKDNGPRMSITKLDHNTHSRCMGIPTAISVFLHKAGTAKRSGGAEIDLRNSAFFHLLLEIMFLGETRLS